MKPYEHCLEDCRFIRDGKCAYREMHVPTIAVDFDRVLFTHESWQGHYHVGEPMPGARDALIMLRDLGFKIMIWTTRAQKEIIAEACEKNGIPYDYINENPNQPPEINPSKPVADYYIDDRAVRFTTWPEVFNEIFQREKHDPYYNAPTKSCLCEVCKLTPPECEKRPRPPCPECIWAGQLGKRESGRIALTIYQDELDSLIEEEVLSEKMKVVRDIRSRKERQ